MRRILIIGGGFAGITAANAILTNLTPRRKIEVQMVSQESHFTFTPLLPNVASGRVDPVSILVPIHDVVGDRITFEMDRITKIDPVNRVAHGSFDHPFDYLIFCPGSVPSWPAPHWREWTTGCHSARDAVEIRERVTRAFENYDDSPHGLRFVIIGAGPTGVSLAAEMQSLIFDEMLPLYPHLAKHVEILLYEQQERVLPNMAEELSEPCSKHLQSLGVEVIHKKVTDVSENAVVVSGETIGTQHVFWTGGVGPNPLVDASGLKQHADRRLLVDSQMRALGHHGIYVAGDSAHSVHPWSAQVANQQALVAAHNVLADTIGRSFKDFEYTYQGDIISLGRNNAAVFYQGMAFEGRAAQALYQVVYTALIPTSMQKIKVFRDWVSSAKPSAQRRLE